MTLEEIRASGLLELYALGQLSAREHALVEQHLSDFPELRKDLAQIEKVLERYAQASGVNAPAGVRERILKEIQGDAGSITAPTKQGRNIWPAISAIAILLLLGLLYFFSQKNRELELLKDQIDTVRDSCTQQGQQYLAQIETLRQLTLPDDEILHMAGTEKFPQTDLYFHHNPVTKRNFIQVRNLPPIAANQSYQLWSLKPDVAPIPLDVFQDPAGQILEVQHVDDTQSYAITIEPRGGRQSPTLENLIGIVTIGS